MRSADLAYDLRSVPPLSVRGYKHLKPHVLRTPDDGRAITEELRAKIRTLEPFRTQGTIP